ncbi:hypothetical protein E8E12_000709 [Didymella heteroderae]|uniref:AB hydrolase-1 domain-containing protein n=1 Tax=Didymella heteroderae TaxID=1769908 RepID=A0A9P4WKE8_9PLEO|nr:hypothetical protein E8E12_000709 [Didymella heteroderae]
MHSCYAAAALETRQRPSRFLNNAYTKPLAFPFSSSGDKIFGSFESDAESQLVMPAAAPLYSEIFDPDAVLARTLKTVYYAESHNELYSETEKCFDYRELLHKVRARTLIIAGSEDWICPPSQSRIMAASIPDARLEIFAGTNHSVHIEKNCEVIAVVRDWIDCV